MIRHVFLFFLYTLAGVLLLKVIVAPGFTGGDVRADMLAIMEGEAWTPYQYRMFMPFLAKQIVQTLPGGFKERLEKHLEKAGRFEEWKFYNLPSSRLVPYAVMWSLSFLCFIGSFYIWRALAYHYYPSYTLMADYLPLLGAMLITLFFRYSSYPYDPMTVLISSLMFYLITLELWAVFVPTFLVSLFCRESSVLFLVLAFLRVSHRTPSFYIYLGVLALCGMVVRVLIPIHYEDNGHVYFEWDNIKYIFKYPTAIVYTILMFAFIGFLAFKNWSKKDTFLKKSFLTVYIPLSILMVLVGRIDEFRVLLEGFAILLMLTFSTVLSLYPDRIQETKR